MKNQTTASKKLISGFLRTLDILKGKTPGRNSSTAKQNKPIEPSDESANRYSLLYTLNGQYHHIGFTSEESAHIALSEMMIEENRIPIGIYDSKTDEFQWEIIGQYFHSMDPAEIKSQREEEILNIARALRRRDSSWIPGHLQRPGLFA